MAILLKLCLLPCVKYIFAAEFCPIHKLEAKAVQGLRKALFFSKYVESY